MQTKEQPQQPTIAEMSEVVAKYMGEIVHTNDEGVKYMDYTTNDDYNDTLTLMEWAKYHSSWDWIHEVWEKVREYEYFKNTILYDPIATLLAFGTKEQVFTELHRIIQFINNLKQENNYV